MCIYKPKFKLLSRLLNYNHYYISYVFLSFILFIFKRCFVNQYIPDHIKGSKTASTFHLYKDVKVLVGRFKRP